MFRREEDASKKNILRRKANWVGRILRRNCLLHDAVVQMAKVEGIERRKGHILIILKTEENIGN
jgi:hypothetical protein